MVITLNIYVFACVASSSLTCGTQHLCVMQYLLLLKEELSVPTGGIRQTLNNYSSFIYLSHSLSLSVLSLPSFSILIFLLT